MILRVHHLCFITWFSFHQCCMTSTAFDLHGLYDQLVFCHKWVIWCSSSLIFCMQYIFFFRYVLFQSKYFQNPDFWQSGFLTIRILDFGQLEAMKAFIFFSYCQSCKLNGNLGIQVFWNSGFFPGNPVYLLIFLLLH